MVQTASVLYPSPLSFLGIAREIIAGSPELPTNTVPVAGPYEPEDAPEYLRDQNLRAVMTGLFGETLGPEASTFSYGGVAFADTDGFWLDNIFGDLSSVSNGTLGTARILTAALAVGDTSLTVGASLGAVTTGSVIQISDGAASEIVIATVGSTATAVNFTGTPCRFAHAASVTAVLETASSNYTHTFAVLNSGSGQPPVHTLTDYTGVTALTGARSYPAAVVGSLEFNGNGGVLLTRTVGGTAWISAPSASTPSNILSAAAPIANWQCTVTVGGSPTPNVTGWGASFKREMVVYYGANSSQNPFTIARGNLSAGFSLDSMAVNETPLTSLFSGPQTLVFSLSNGLAGAAELAMTITATQAQTVAAKPVRGAEVIAYEAGWEAVANSTDIGGSGGLGPCTVQLINAIPTY